MKTYAVHSLFQTIQGEGYWTGRPAIFLRFSGCNLWTGREEDRATAVCQFCDTDFLSGERMTADEIVGNAVELWGTERNHRFVVLTGGEPTLQADWDLIATLHRFEFTVAIETNGTQQVKPPIDWITVSPKAGAKVAQTKGDELKLVFPQAGAGPDRYTAMAFEHWFLQPMDGPDRERNTRLAVEYCIANPRWRLSLQTHKFIGLP